MLLLDQLLFGDHTRGHVRERSHEVLHAAPFWNRRDTEVVPEHRTVLAVAAQRDRAAPAALQPRPQLVQTVLASVVALQKAAVLAQHFPRPITGKALETLVHVDRR